MFTKKAATVVSRFEELRDRWQGLLHKEQDADARAEWPSGKATPAWVQFAAKERDEIRAERENLEPAILEAWKDERFVPAVQAGYGEVQRALDAFVEAVEAAGAARAKLCEVREQLCAGLRVVRGELPGIRATLGKPAEPPPVPTMPGVQDTAGHWRRSIEREFKGWVGTWTS